MNDKPKQVLELVKTVVIIAAVVGTGLFVVHRVSTSREKLLDDMIAKIKDNKAAIADALDLDKKLAEQTNAIQTKIDALKQNQSQIDQKVSALQGAVSASRQLLEKTQRIAEIALAEQNRALSEEDFMSQKRAIEFRLTTPVRVLPDLVGPDNQRRRGVGITDGQLKAENSLFDVADRQVTLIADQDELLKGNSEKIGNLNSIVSALNSSVNNWEARYQGMKETVDKCKVAADDILGIAQKMKKSVYWKIGAGFLGGVVLGVLVRR